MKSVISRLLTEDPLATFARRHASYVERYQGKEDPFGYSLSTFALWEPLFRFLFEDYFKVDIKGIENIPGDGAAILVGNHSGLLPLDGAMISMAMTSHHPKPRRVRYLATDWFFTLPGLCDWVRQTGQVRATRANALKLLEMEELIGIYPEGTRGVGKPFRERYRLLDFHPGFVQLAIETGTPLIPVSTLGGDEIYPEFVNLKELARFIGMPFYPLTLTFPWLPFPLYLIPLPVCWKIHIHQPIKLDYPKEAANDRKLVHKLAREVQYQIQHEVNEILASRQSLFSSGEKIQK